MIQNTQSGDRYILFSSERYTSSTLHVVVTVTLTIVDK